jgi:fumarate reductase subunit C
MSEIVAQSMSIEIWRNTLYALYTFLCVYMFSFVLIFHLISLKIQNEFLLSFLDFQWGLELESTYYKGIRI